MKHNINNNNNINEIHCNFIRHEKKNRLSCTRILKISINNIHQLTMSKEYQSVIPPIAQTQRFVQCRHIVYVYLELVFIY